MEDHCCLTSTRRGFRRLCLASAAACLFLLPGVSCGSEVVSNRFDLFVPVTLSVLEVSEAVGLVPAPLVVCAAMHLDAISNAVQEVLR